MISERERQNRDELFRMEIEKLIERLQNWDGIKPDREIDCAIEGLKALQAENDRLKKEVQQMRWIPVEERLPDKPGHYLVCTNVNYWHGGCMDKNGSSSNAGTTDGYAGTTLSVLDCFYDITGDWNRVCNAHVTHWMPLPPSPPAKGEK